MPIDASIPLGPAPQAPGTQLSNLINMAGGLQSFQNAQTQGQILQQNQQDSAITLRERQAMTKVMANPSNYTDGNGDISMDKFMQVAPQVAPTTWSDYASKLLTAQKQSVDVNTALNNLTTANREQLGQTVYNMKGQSAGDVSKALDALGSQYKGMDIPIQVLKQQLAGAKTQEEVDSILAGAAKKVLPQQTQQTMASGTLIPTNTAEGTKFIQGSVGADTPQGQQVGATQKPPNQFITSSNGSQAVGNTATGEIAPAIPVANHGGPAPVLALPAGETQQTRDELQTQRSQTQAQLSNIPIRQNLYREVLDTLKGGVTTGDLGALQKKIGSLTGYSFGAGSAYNELGKWLAQENAQAAQAMGPHTNAGMANAQAATGSTDYDPETLAKITKTSSANLVGVSEYQKGLETSIKNQTSKTPGVDPIFVKREYDNAWGNAYDPRITRLSNAAQNGDAGEIADVMKSVGVHGSIVNGQWVRDPHQTPTKAELTLKAKAKQMQALSNGGL